MQSNPTIESLIARMVLHRVLLFCVLFLLPHITLATQPSPVYPELHANLLSTPKAVIAEAQQLYLSALATQNKTQQLTSLHLLAKGYLTLEDDAELLRVANTGAELAEAELDSVYRSEFQHFRAIVLEKQGELSKALEALNKSISLAELTGDEQLIAQQVSGLGRFHLYRENYDLALQAFLSSHKIYEKYNDKHNLGMSYNDLAVLYESTGEYEKALEYHLKAASYGDENDLYDMVLTHLNLGSAYSGMGKLEQAEEELNKGRELAKQIQDETSLAYSSYWLGEIRSWQQQYPAALIYFREALDLFVKHPDALMLFNCHLELAFNSIPLYDYAAAHQHISEAEQVYKKLSTPILKLDLLEAKLSLNQAMKNYQRTSEIFAERSILQAQIYDLEKEKNLEKLKLRFHTTQKENENTILQQKIAVQKLQLKKNLVEQRYQIIAITLIIVILAFTFMAYLKQKKLKQRMTILASTDDLTGLPNRRRILNIAEQEMERANRYNNPLSLAIIDLDHFKQINDHFGHDAGDRVLQEFTRIFKDIIRKHDSLGRMGGEEWLGVFPHTRPEELISVLERVSQRYANTRISGISANSKLTFSAGITLLTSADTELDSALKRADRALYEAKENGRNRIIVSPLPAEPISGASQSFQNSEPKRQ